MHQKSQCPLRPYQCKFCGLKDNYLKITGTAIPGFFTTQEGASHYDECLMYPLVCPNMCGVTDIKRKDMTHHRFFCAMELVDCPFAEAGCKNKLFRYELDNHVKSSMQAHLLLVMKAYTKMKDKLQKTEAKLIATEATLTTAVQLLRQGNKSDKEIVDSITSCSTFLTKHGDSIQIVMPRVSEYHRKECDWFSPPFYHKLGYKMCLAVKVLKLLPGTDVICTLSLLVLIFWKVNTITS